MTKMKKKYSSGIATSYISQTRVLKKLQLSLQAFRRLCILKGIYPREPPSIKKAGRGSRQPTTYYLLKDIKWLQHETLISKLRMQKIYFRKLKTARERRDRARVKRLRRNRPVMTLDHLVKERYPTFEDALRDLDDCLTLSHLFASISQARFVSVHKTRICRRLCSEFAQYCIVKRALRTAFVSIKGIYYQADVQGERITWIVPHSFVQEVPLDVDLRVMGSFVDFYIWFLGFVNFKLFQSANLVYPPSLGFKEPDVRDINTGMCAPDDYGDEIVASLNIELKLSDRGQIEEHIDFDQIPQVEVSSPSEETEEDPNSARREAAEKRRAELERVQQIQHLFDGLYFFLGRETNRHSLTFIIRSLGGHVSWDASESLGATYAEDDSRITHQIVDRAPAPSLNSYLNTPATSKPQLALGRLYVQPQWVYDCLNRAQLLPVELYLPGARLPPHYSPFDAHPGPVPSSGSTPSAPAIRKVAPLPKSILKVKGTSQSPAKEQLTSISGEEAIRKKGTEKMGVLPGNAIGRPLSSEEAHASEEWRSLAAKGADRRLRESLLPKKHRNLYKKLRHVQKERRQESERLERNRAKLNQDMD